MKANLHSVEQIIIPILHQHDVAHAAVFGSFARGSQTEESDLDLLVEFRGEKSLLDLVGLQMELEEILGIDVDVVTHDALHPRIRDRIIKELIEIL